MWNHEMPHNQPSRFEVRVTYFLLLVMSVGVGVIIWGVAAVVNLF